MENLIIDTEDKLKDKHELLQKLEGIHAVNDTDETNKITVLVSNLKPNPID